MLALVGENGAGKTTLVKLLARLYDPDEGRILLDGLDLRDYDLVELRANIGVIFQDFVRYHLTAAENIAVGRIDERDDRARIVEAAERSLADDVIAKLPDGYDQMLGKRFQTGVELSGGEWQKIAIARAYMRDAQVLILDEPTAALDARSEFEVFQRFKELSDGKTAVLISHRFSSVRMADRILVLVDGAVEADGHARRAAAAVRALCRAVRTAGGGVPIARNGAGRRLIRPARYLPLRLPRPRAAAGGVGRSLTCAFASTSFCFEETFMSRRLLALSAPAAGAAALSGCVVVPLDSGYGYGGGYGYGPAAVRVAPPLVVVPPPRHRHYQSRQRSDWYR